MNQAIRIEVKTLPDTLRAALKSVEYHCTDIGVEVSDKVSANAQGSAGSRGFVLVVDIASGEMKRHMGSWGGASACENRQVDLDTNTYDMRPGFAVISGSMGYPRTFATMYLHPENMAKYLPAAPQVSDRDRTILDQFNGLTSAGRKDEWSRYPQSRPTETELNSLVSRGLLARNAAGATRITTAGKNAR
jgi:hypothetical protein